MLHTLVALENRLRYICLSSYPLEWDENHLTFLLMKELRTLFSNRTINFNGWSKIVDWQSFKNRSNQENLYGDIALLVHIQFTTGETLKGVVNIEAKRDYNGGNFEAIDLPQLTRICENAPHSHLLLYSHDIEETPLVIPDGSIWPSCMHVSPINTAKELLFQLNKSNNKRVLRTSFPLTIFLTSRVFWGLDLDYRKELYDDIANGLTKLFNPAFLGIVNVYYENQNRVEINLSDIWQEIE